MTKPKNVRSTGRPLPSGAHISSPGVIQPVTPHFTAVEVAVASFPDAPGLLMLRLDLDGRPLFIPARQMLNPANFAAVQLQPQFVCFFSDVAAEAFHQQQVAQIAAAKQAAAVALWTPDKARKGLVH